MDEILGLAQGTSLKILSNTRSLISFKAGSISFTHDTVPAFVTGCKRKGHAWYVDMDEQRDFLTMRCFDLMASSLPMIVQHDDEHIPASLEYACIHWSEHPVDCPYSEHAVIRVRTSLENHVTFWMTALSVLERMDVAGPTLERVSSWVPLSVLFSCRIQPKNPIIHLFKVPGC